MMNKLFFAGLTASIVMLGSASFAQSEPAGLSPWLIRLRAMSVWPDESTKIRPISGKAHVENVVVPELDINYFFTDNVAAELVLMTSKHNVNATLAGVGKVDLGGVRRLLPTLLLQYHFRPHQTFRPYAGAGLNYTIFWDEDAPGGAVTGIDYDNNIGYAL